MKAALANRLWLFTSRKAAKDFHQASQNVAETQAGILRNYLTKNENTSYLKTKLPITNYQSLPLTTYEDYLPYIDRIANGEQDILTRDPVQLFELSSGSTSASKMIPYTRTLKREFGFGLSAWIHDLYTHHPALMAGPAYWSISPLTSGPRRTPAGIPIGFEEDSAYLGSFGSVIESSLMAVPNFVKHIQDVDDFRYVTLLYLLRCEDLRLISVWNPTFLTLLLAPFETWWDSLLKDIADGTITPPNQSPIPNSQFPNKPRSRTLSKITPTNYPSIWQHLSLISCWADGASEPYAKELQSHFPNVTIQPKGLLATEAFISFPLTGYDGGALAVTSHYFEFLAENGDIFLAHQLEKEKKYSVIVTTGGGLYRYQLNDIVEVTDFYNQIPCVKFIGKADKVSDFFGEKLNEQFVAGVLKELFAKHNLNPTFYMLAPDDTPPFHYTLYIELAGNSTTQLSDHLTTELDNSLRTNFHYDYCRKLGQLAETQTVQVKDGGAAYIRACQGRGQKLGDIKPSVLQRSTGWGDVFKS
ncbi:MAG: GH3 auxin-responsive promoter family protein [Anaerolineales bacterium]|uniref:GH3 auxin-responsive promoter family protein n=1 Tax=Candidatus Villigracilis vicinus TaxID=3140679 RepID=UPI0031362961|nr:GH3 auxin-responsive promoter family protein [Anaerolineales bacterium]